jgi:hypothetical protein
MEQKKLLTEEEYNTLDEYFTNNTIMPKPGKPGVLTRMGLLAGELESDVTEYLRVQAAATHRTQAQIVCQLVREKIAVSQ